MKNFRIYIDICESYNGGISDSQNDNVEAERKMNMIINFLVAKTHDPKRTAAHLWKFAMKNDQRAYQIIRGMSDSLTDYKTIIKYIKELRKKCESIGVSETFNPIILRSSYSLINKSIMPPLIKIVVDNNGTDDDCFKNQLSHCADFMIKTIGNSFPAIFKALGSTFLSMLDSGDANTCEDGLYALATYLKAFENDRIEVGYFYLI